MTVRKTGAAGKRGGVSGRDAADTSEVGLNIMHARMFSFSGTGLKMRKPQPMGSHSLEVKVMAIK